MRKFTRLEEPAYLAENWEEWGREWESRRVSNTGASWHWHQIDKASVDHMMLPLLREQTQSHCSFCDAFPVSPPSIDTIEHFRPKAEFPREAYHWENLYYCCCFCQRKEGAFSELALRPDAPDYEFERYFLWNYTEGTIEVNPTASAQDQARAEFTRRYFRLNEGHPTCRLEAQHWYGRHLAEDLDRVPYRHFLE